MCSVLGTLWWQSSPWEKTLLSTRHCFSTVICIFLLLLISMSIFPIHFPGQGRGIIHLCFVTPRGVVDKGVIRYILKGWHRKSTVDSPLTGTLGDWRMPDKWINVSRPSVNLNSSNRRKRRACCTSLIFLKDLPHQMNVKLPLARPTNTYGVLTSCPVFFWAPSTY